MPSLEALIAVTLAGLALSITPGPSMLYVLSRSVGQSRAAGLASAVGLCLGGLLLAVATAFGLAELFQRIDWLAEFLRYVGAAYLAILGYRMIREGSRMSKLAMNVHEIKTASTRSIVWQGVLVEALNPKTVLFFALFIPPFLGIDGSLPAGHEIRAELLVLGVLVPLTAVPMDLAVALGGGRIAQEINKQRDVRKWLAWLSGCVLIGIAANLLLQAP